MLRVADTTRRAALMLDEDVLGTPMGPTVSEEFGAWPAAANGRPGGGQPLPRRRDLRAVRDWLARRTPNGSLGVHKTRGRRARFGYRSARAARIISADQSRELPRD
jgi:hypothetical protein